ncbi:probable inactive receptor kinase At1g48480 [Miscanthus floridulus]|uniref:probable inactive receptor kinase At1g48480 n=1 Tax=Miscanthus floridulus TaxID=154761 RepID=UPI003458778F
MAELALHSKEAMSPNDYTLCVLEAQPPLPLLSVWPAISAAATGWKKLFCFSRIPRPYNLEDLLHVSTEVLGKGTYGTTYKAVIESRPIMAVKRLKETSLPEHEFRDKVAAIGGINHPNVVLLQPWLRPVTAELGVEEAHHAGLEYIHTMGSMAMHGNIKSSNILLSRTVDARVAEHGLTYLVGPAGTPTARVMGFGMLLLELLMEKAPMHVVLHNKGVDLPRWACSMVKKEWTSEVFNMELLRHPVPKEEMVGML